MKTYKLDKKLTSYDKDELKEIFQVRLTGTGVIIESFESLEDARFFIKTLSKDVLISLESFIKHSYTFHRVSNIINHDIQ